MLEWWEQLLEQDWLQYSFYGNSAGRWLGGLAAFLLALVVCRTIMAVVHGRAKRVVERFKADWARGVVDLLAATRSWFLLVVSLYVGTLVLDLPEQTKSIAQSAAVMALVLQGAVWGSVLIKFWLNRYVKARLDSDAASVTTMTALGVLAQTALWSIAALLILDNFGIEVTALIAGLGIGGIAVALAAQNVLGDLFASLMIVLDKPFVLGDFIIVGDFMGTVEKIGLKTTRIRSLSGEQLIFANNDLLQSRLRNLKRMSERRIEFSIGVTYQTPYEKTAAIPQMIREAVESNDQVRFGRSHFKAYGDSALVYETVYHVTVPEYDTYMDVQQNVNLSLFKRFAEEGIEFAYPTQTVFLHKDQPAGSPDVDTGA